MLVCKERERSEELLRLLPYLPSHDLDSTYLGKVLIP